MDSYLFILQMYLVYHNVVSYLHAEVLTFNNFTTRWHSLSTALNPPYILSGAWEDSQVASCASQRYIRKTLLWDMAGKCCFSTLL